MTLSELNTEEQENIRLTVEAKSKAYAPYSHFAVGALAVSTRNRKFPGCNIESADFTLTSHAEMTAIHNMVSGGETELRKIYIALDAENKIPVPCGLCRQKMSEFAENENIPVIVINTSADPLKIYSFTLKELYPYPFTKSYLKESV